MTAEVDTMNGQAVGAQGDSVVVLLPKQRMTKAEALSQAAWLICIAETIEFDAEFDAKFARLLRAVRTS